MAFPTDPGREEPTESPGCLRLAGDVVRWLEGRPGLLVVRRLQSQRDRPGGVLRGATELPGDKSRARAFGHVTRSVEEGR